MGVRRAVDAAEKMAVEYKDKGLPMFTLGPLIHNPALMDSLEKKGVSVLESDFSGVKEGCPVVIRAHGASPHVVRTLEEKGAVIIDATCPRVMRSQKLVNEWSRKGYSVIIAGDKNHGEVTGIYGYFEKDCGGVFTVVQSVEEARSIVPDEKTMLLAQTTFSLEEYEEIKKILREKNGGIKIFDTICPATMERQKSLLELKGKPDAILVIGGKNSANTARLFETACKICPKTALIESPSEIPADFFALDKIALTAGASTPDWIIEEVVSAL